MKGSPLAIVEFLLESLPQNGTPAQVLYTYLQACYTPNPGDLQHFRCPLNVNTHNLKPHLTKVDNLVKKLKR